MKNLTLFVVFALGVANCFAQSAIDAPKIVGDHQGFYLSLALGPNISNVTLASNLSDDMEFSGAGTLLDIKLGGSIGENLLLHATLTSSFLVGPKISVNGMSGNSSNDISLGEALIGAGLTYYSPTNILISGSLGIGNYTLSNDEEDIDISTDRGLGLQLKLGKEWWVSNKWGLGVAVTYSHLGLTNKPGGGLEEVMRSDNFGIVFNASLN